jgi:FixJ family two-component response regulator
MLSGVDGIKKYVDLLRSDINADLDCSPYEILIEACLGGSAEKSDKAPPQPTEAFDDTTATFSNQNLKSPTENINAENFENSIVPKVIVVEDEELVRLGIIEALPIDWQCKGFDRAEDALQYLESNSADLIISDLKLIGISGQEMFQQLRDKKIEIPVIFISGYADRENLVQFVKLGAFDFFDKPFDFEELAGSANRALRQWYYSKSVEEISALAFRTYMKFSQIDELVDLKGLEAGKRTRIREIEESLMHIGKLCQKIIQFR